MQINNFDSFFSIWTFNTFPLFMAKSGSVNWFRASFTAVSSTCSGFTLSDFKAFNFQSHVLRGVNPSSRFGGPNAEGVWGTVVPQQGPLVGVWGQSPQKLKDITELNLNSECNCKLHRCVLKNCILCMCDKFAVSPEKYHLKDKSVFSVFYHS